MEAFKKKIKKIEKNHSLLTIEDIIKLMKEYYRKYRDTYTVCNIFFYFQNGDNIRMCIEKEDLYGSTTYNIFLNLMPHIIKIIDTDHWTPDPTAQWSISHFLMSLLEKEDIYYRLKDIIGDKVINYEISGISFTGKYEEEY